MSTLRRPTTAANNGSLEPATIRTLDIHRRHFERILTKRLDTSKLTPKHLQSYINTRAKAKGKFGHPLCGSTIKKELVTLRIVWNWAKELRLVSEKVSLQKLRFPKSFELLPFQTRTQIERQIENGRLSGIEIGQFLNQIKSCLRQTIYFYSRALSSWRKLVGLHEESGAISFSTVREAFEKKLTFCPLPD